MQDRVGGGTPRSEGTTPVREAQASPPPARLDAQACIRAIAAEGDRAAFAALFGYFAPRLKTYLLRRGATPAAAEDLAQEAMLAVWRKAASFDPARASAATWIFTIARNLRIDAQRREHRGGQAEPPCEVPEDLASEASDAETTLLLGEQEERLRAALRALPPDQGRVIELSFYRGLAHPEIERTLGIPLGTVKSRLRLAMARLRAALEGGR